MLGLLTIIGFVIAWKEGGWWWLIAIVICLAWLANKQEKKEKEATASESVSATKPVDSPVQKSTAKRGSSASRNQPKDRDKSNAWVITLTEICSNFSASDFYVAELIPESKLKSAIKSYPLPDGDSPIALIDTTLFGSADDGMLIGEHGLSWHNYITKTTVSSLRWETFSRITLSLDESDIKFGDIGVFETSGSSLGKEKIFTLLKAIQASYAETNKDVTSQPTDGNDIIKINVNLASFDDLLSLPGIGAAEAKMIIDRRETMPFHSLTSFADFIGLKPHKLDKLSGMVIFSEPDLSYLSTSATPSRVNTQDDSKITDPPVTPVPRQPTSLGREID